MVGIVKLKSRHELLDVVTKVSWSVDEIEFAAVHVKF